VSGAVAPRPELHGELVKRSAELTSKSIGPKAQPNVLRLTTWPGLKARTNPYPASELEKEGFIGPKGTSDWVPIRNNQVLGRSLVC
jgi:hypothetical protein